MFIPLPSCSQTIPKLNIIPTPSPASPTANWGEFSSKFTSDIGIIEYIIRYPQDWYIYPGTTLSAAGLEGQTYIQNFERIGCDDLSCQAAGTIKLGIYALPCAITEEGCDTKDLPTLSPGLPGERKVEERSSFTIWTVFLYANSYRFSLNGYMPGTPEKNADLIKILDAILSTVIIK